LQIDLLLAQAYQYWNKPEDALSVYDELIATHKGDFRAYLAKGILLKQRNREADAEQYLEKVSNMPAFKSLAESLQKPYPASLRCERRMHNMPAFKLLAESLQKPYPASLRCERRMQSTIVPT
jgi:tetratricopeptide (TPR) repeat protein